MIEKKESNEEVNKTGKDSSVEKESVAPVKKSDSVDNKSEASSEQEPSASKKAESWIKIQTAEGWKRERRQEKLGDKKE